MLTKLAEALNPIKSVGEVVKSIITTFKVDPETRQQLEIAAAQAQLEIERARLESRIKLEEVYIAESANLREQVKMEIGSQDPFVRRARPWWLWLLSGIYGLNYGGTTVVNWFNNAVPVEFPAEVHYLTAFLVGGYGMLRTIEKGGVLHK